MIKVIIQDEGSDGSDPALDEDNCLAQSELNTSSDEDDNFESWGSFTLGIQHHQNKSNNL